MLMMMMMMMIAAAAAEGGGGGGWTQRKMSVFPYARQAKRVLPLRGPLRFSTFLRVAVAVVTMKAACSLACSLAQ
jgi:hypothetical protein